MAHGTPMMPLVAYVCEPCETGWKDFVVGGSPCPDCGEVRQQGIFASLLAKKTIPPKSDKDSLIFDPAMGPLWALLASTIEPQSTE